MAAKNSRGGRKAKAPNSADQVFVPSGYLSLGDAVAAAGKAQQRFDQTVGWLRDRLWSGVIPAVVLVASGTAYPMPPPIWGSDSAPAIFKTGNVEFQPETYGWRLGPTAAPLKGRVLIQQEHLDRALSGENTPPQETPEHSAAGGVAVKPRKKGGRPEKYDWDEFWIEVARIANLPDGLPERQGKLVRDMLDWCAQTWEEIPGETTVKNRIRRLYTQAIPKRTET